MPKERGSYERRGNATQRGVRHKVERFRPITAKEMRGAFEAWKEKQPDEPRKVSRNLLLGAAGDIVDKNTKRVIVQPTNKVQ
jgi:hypothetical protein